MVGWAQHIFGVVMAMNDRRVGGGRGQLFENGLSGNICADFVIGKESARHEIIWIFKSEIRSAQPRRNVHFLRAFNRFIAEAVHQIGSSLYCHSHFRLCECFCLFDDNKDNSV